MRLISTSTLILKPLLFCRENIIYLLNRTYSKNPVTKKGLPKTRKLEKAENDNTSFDGTNPLSIQLVAKRYKETSPQTRVYAGSW